MRKPRYMTTGETWTSEFKTDRKSILRLAVADFDDYQETVTLQNWESEAFGAWCAPSFVVDVSGTYDDEADEWNTEKQAEIIEKAAREAFGNKVKIIWGEGA